MMFSIDLLKGKGLPEKTDLKRLLVRVVPFVVPVVAVLVFASGYNHNYNELADLRAKLDVNQRQIEKNKDNVIAYDQIDGQIKQMKKTLTDVSTALNYRVQVSDVMVELVNLLPSDIFIYEMKLDRNATQEHYTDKKTGENKKRLLVNRKLKLTLCGFGVTGDDDAVKTYVENLKQSSILSGIMTDVKPSVRQLGEVDNRPAVYYEIECTLKQEG